ncbi:MAG: LapA family protein [Candidatus Bipolaricaulis sp.]|nr:LapA family protein [Candidatus Bipolaricaulis sp.]
MRTTRLVILALLVALVVAFAAQNTPAVGIRFLGWRFWVSNAVLLAIVCGAGVFIGLLIPRPRKRVPKEEEEEYVHLPTPPAGQ